MKPEPNKQQSDWLNQAEELNDVKAAQVNGGYSSIEARAITLYSQIADRALSFQENTAEAKNDKDNAGKVQA